jgi:hypothetical protein
LVDFHEIWYRGNAIQGDLDAIIFNPIASLFLGKGLGSKAAGVEQKNPSWD